MKLIKNKGFYRLAYKPGHYASPIPNLEEAMEELEREKGLTEIPGVDLNFNGQCAVVKKLAPIVQKIPYKDNRSDQFRYYFENAMFQHTDGSILYGIIKLVEPKRIIEVGSGFSSAIMLDINERKENDRIKLTFTEPYPERLNSLISSNDKQNVIIIEKKIQDIDLNIFDDLEENDVLFLDTSHIAKTGSDVTFWTFNVLPRLKKGVLIHIHDVFWPFNYSEQWVKNNKCYNEAYLIRAFLQFNESFEIFLFNSYLKSVHSEFFNASFPSLMEHHGGGSLWLRKTK